MDEKKEQTYNGRGNVLQSAKYRNRKTKEETDDVFGLIPEETAEFGAEGAEGSQESAPAVSEEIAAKDMALSSGAAQEAGRQTVALNRLNAEQGAGYAAEMANDLLDRMHGVDSHIVGNDNAENGADRWVNGQLVQCKYCQSAQILCGMHSIQAEENIVILIKTQGSLCRWKCPVINMRKLSSSCGNIFRTIVCPV